MRFEEEIKTTKFQSEIHKAHLNILFTAGWLRARFNTYLKPFNITPEQYNVLRIVRGQQDKGIRVKDITHRMLDRSSNTTRIIDRLEIKRLVQRLLSDRDRRERAIILTPAGSALLEEIDVEWLKNNPHSAPISPEEASLVSELLDRMRSV